MKLLYALKGIAAKVKGGSTTEADITSKNLVGVLDYIKTNWRPTVTAIDASMGTGADDHKLTIKLTFSDGTTKQKTVTLPNDTPVSE